MPVQLSQWEGAILGMCVPVMYMQGACYVESAHVVVPAW